MKKVSALLLALVLGLGFMGQAAASSGGLIPHTQPATPIADWAQSFSGSGISVFVEADGVLTAGHSLPPQAAAQFLSSLDFGGFKQTLDTARLDALFADGTPAPGVAVSIHAGEYQVSFFNEVDMAIFMWISQDHTGAFSSIYAFPTGFFHSLVSQTEALAQPDRNLNLNPPTGRSGCRAHYPIAMR